MTTMTQKEIEAFLAERRHAIVGTNRVGGPPQLSPVWYLYQDGRIYLSIDKESVKARHLHRDPHIAVCVDAGYPDGRAVMVEGQAQLISAGDPLQTEIRWQIIRRYHGSEEEARRYVESSDGSGLVLVVVTLEKMIGQDLN
jgi:PPOX class probable F420-dependent enzyme